RRAAALALDPGLLSQLLGQDMLRELLDDDVIAKVEADLQHTRVGRRLTGVEGVADVLRLLGPLTTEELAVRLRAHPEHTEHSEVPQSAYLQTVQTCVEHLVDTRRALRVRIGTVEYWCAIEDAPRLRDGLGVPLPVGVPAALAES